MPRAECQRDKVAVKTKGRKAGEMRVWGRGRAIKGDREMDGGVTGAHEKQ